MPLCISSPEKIKLKTFSDEIGNWLSCGPIPSFTKMKSREMYKVLNKKTRPFLSLLATSTEPWHIALCATPEKAAPQAPPSPGFSRQE